MPRPVQSLPMPAFQPIDGLKETTQAGMALLEARNILLRPLGGFKGPPTYQRLWATGSSETMQAFYRRQTFTGFPSGVGASSGDRTTNKTCAYLISRQGKATLVFYDLVSSQCRGLFYLGDDGSYSSGSYDFTAGTPTVTVLAVGLDSTARWYGTKMGGKALFLGNGVDENVIAQLGRSATPGKWRKAASNVAPSAPVISVVTPASSSNVQAYWNITTRASGTNLTFTANSGLFPGLSGNNKIRVRITNTGTAEALRATLTGQGTAADPYYYNITAGSTTLNSSNNAIVSFVNLDSQVLALLAASTAAASGTADNGSYGPADLENGSGTGNSAGYSNRTVTFYARYWDPGTDGYGYEGVSSPISNEIIIPSSANNDIRVLVPVDSTAEGGRFGFLRLYMQFEEVPDAVWLLINPDDPVPNGLTSTLIVKGLTNAVSLTGAWAQNDVGRVTTTGTLPTGLTAGTDYYLQPRPTQSGTFTQLANTNAITLTGVWAENDSLLATTSGSLPGGLTAGTPYFLRPRTATGTFTRYLATDEVTLSGTQWVEDDAVVLTTTGTLPTGLSPGTYYLRPGTATGRWKLSTIPGGAAVALTGSGTGTHTATLTAGSGQWYLSLTSGGSAVTISSAGSGTQTATLSRQSTEWILATSADGTATSISNSGTGTHTFTLTKKCVQVGTQTPFLPAEEGGEMFDNQNRPLPHTLHAFTNEQVWRGGNPTYPERLYISKPSTADEVAPEGCSLDEQAFVPAINQSQVGGTNKVTALVASQNRLECHYPGGVSMRDPANPDQVNYTVTGAGAINQTAVAVWEQKGVFILGGDLQLRMQSVEQTGAGFAAAVASSSFAALTAAQYLRDRVDLAELARKPQRVFVFPNVADQHLYMSLPALDGTLKMFAYDFLTGGIVGEFDYPKIYAATQMEPDRPEILFADEDGNLMVWDTRNQADRGDVLATSAAWTAHSTGSAPPAQYNGWGYVDVGSARYYQAGTSVLKTCFQDFSSPAQRKALTGILFRCVKNSRARISVTLRTLDQQETTITAEPAQTYARVEHRLNRFLGRSTSLQLEFRIVSAEQAPWIIRDVCGLWLPQGRV